MARGIHFGNNEARCWLFPHLEGILCPCHHQLAPYADALYISLVFASESYRNCLEVERLLMKDIRNAELSARDRAVCASALDRILERKRILRMKPAPKAVDVDKYEGQKRRTRKIHLVEPTEV
jgi:hypothetical protein